MKLWKSVKLLLRVLGITLLVVGIVVSLVYWAARLFYSHIAGDFFANSERAFKIPEIDMGFIPQGIDYDERSDCFIVTGYRRDKSASPIFIINKTTGKVEKKIYTLDKFARAGAGHNGGICVHGDYIYIAGSSDGCLYVYSYEDMIKAVDNSFIQCLGTVDARLGDADYIRIAFVSVYQNELILGEYYSDDGFNTPESHKFKTPSGGYNQALALCYKLNDANEEFEYGINPVPRAAYSLPSRVQGIDFSAKNVYLSRSRGINYSQLCVYERASADYGEIEIEDNKIPLYFLDSKCLVNRKHFMPMAEEIVFVDDVLYVMNESAANKYLIGKFYGGKYCYAAFDLKEKDEEFVDLDMMDMNVEDVINMEIEEVIGENSKEDETDVQEDDIEEKVETEIRKENIREEVEDIEGEGVEDEEVEGKDTGDQTQ